MLAVYKYIYIYLTFNKLNFVLKERVWGDRGSVHNASLTFRGSNPSVLYMNVHACVAHSTQQNACSYDVYVVFI